MSQKLVGNLSPKLEGKLRPISISDLGDRSHCLPALSRWISVTTGWLDDIYVACLVAKLIINLRMKLHAVGKGKKLAAVTTDQCIRMTVGYKSYDQNSTVKQ